MKIKWIIYLGVFVLLFSVSTYVFATHMKSESGAIIKEGKKSVMAEKSFQLPVIGSKENLKDYFETIIEEDRRHVFLMKDGAVEETAESNSADKGSGGASVSETNIQVQGVDEADIVKTDGNHIFQVVDRKVNIIETNNGKGLKRLNPITFSEDFSPYQLFLHQNKLIVIGHSYEKWNKKDQLENSMIAPVHELSKVIIYDISDPKAPKEERILSYQGHIVSSRKIENFMYIVTNHYPAYWLMREQTNVDLRPRFADSSVQDELLPVDYDEIHYFPDSKESNFTMIAAVNLENVDAESTVTTYLGGGNQLYMSKENLYLAVQDWGALPLVDGFTNEINTTIYKFAIQELNIDFHSKTEVEGRILNQFSMDEHDGYFRVATTQGMVWNDERPSANNLFIFDENLKSVSSIENLARGERIYSARFMGDKIYIVTFKETDPLFVIDASNPKQPKLLGELKIPGFSNYLHPLDENHLIGFGHDTKVVPQKESKEPLILTEGIKLSLFDVTDMKNPKEKFTEVIGGRGTYSPLNYDHKALLYNNEKNLFAFPINVYKSVEGSDWDQQFEFQGAYVYNIDKTKGFNLETKITHMVGNELYEEWENEITRLLYIGDILYVLSNSSISAHSLDDFKFIGRISL